MSRTCLNFAGCLIALGLLSIGSSASAVVVHDEAIDGDLSGVYSAPTGLSLQPGTNSLIASMGFGDLEYVRIDLPANHQLSELAVISYESEDQVSFIGLQSGSAFTFPANQAAANIANMLGYALWGPDDTELLSHIGVGPLVGPTYTLWIQQTGNPTNFQLDFIVTPIPEPATWLLLGMTVLAGASTRRLWRRAKV